MEGHQVGTLFSNPDVMIHLKAEKRGDLQGLPEKQRNLCL
jgi:hypothetical protein